MPPIRLVFFSIARGAFVPQHEGYGYEKKNKKKTKILLGEIQHFFLQFALSGPRTISFAAFPKPNCKKVAATGPRPWLALLEPRWEWVALNMARSGREEKLFGALQVPCPGLWSQRGCSNKQHVIWVINFRLIAGYSPPASHGPHSAPKRKKLGLWV